MSRSAQRAAFAAIIKSGVTPVSGHVKSQVPWHVGPFCDPSAIIARKAESQARWRRFGGRAAGVPIMPPLTQPWIDEAEYVDPKFAEQIMTEAMMLEDPSGKL